MSVGTSVSILEPFPPQLIELFLESLRRDAFVMEAFNYENPAIAAGNDFKNAFELLYKQICALFGKETVLITAIDAHKREDHPGAREVLTGVGHPKLAGTRVWGPRSVVDKGAVNLGECSLNADRSLNFCANVVPELFQFLNDRGAELPSSEPLLAPYLVRRVTQSLDGKKYGDIIELWERTKSQSDLMFTRAFAGSAPTEIETFFESYFAAILLVYVPSSFPVNPACIAWLEALHLSFQISWGIPALEEHKRELAALRREQIDMRNRTEMFRRLQVLAHTISDKIHEHSNQLIRELDPGIGIDREDLAYLFMNSTPDIWSGSGVRVHGLHDYKVDPLIGQAIVYYAIHRVFGTVPAATLTLQELKDSARKCIETTEGQSSPTLSALLGRIVEADEVGFDLIKELTLRMHTVNAELPFYAFAVRLLLGPVGDDFYVDIAHKSTHVKLGRSSFLDLDILSAVLMEPCFPKTSVRPKEWMGPLVNLIAIQLRGLTENKDVSIPFVSIVRRPDYSEIICPLKGSDRGIKDVKNILNDTPSKEWSVRGFRGALWQLSTVQTSGKVRWNINDALDTLTFIINKL